MLNQRLESTWEVSSSTLLSLSFTQFPYSLPLHFLECAGCGDSIRTLQSVVALNRHWHLFCFTCYRCKKYLTTEYMHKYVCVCVSIVYTSVYTQCSGDQAYCETCYQELYGMLCDNCEEFITGAVLEVGVIRHFIPTNYSQPGLFRPVLALQC